jgi:hypothetical protein
MVVVTVDVAVAAAVAAAVTVAVQLTGDLVLVSRFRCQLTTA